MVFPKIVAIVNIKFTYFLRLLKITILFRGYVFREQMYFFYLQTLCFQLEIWVAVAPPWELTEGENKFFI